MRLSFWSEVLRPATELSDGRDGISYLIAAKEAGVTTPLSAAYEEEIKNALQVADLAGAPRKARSSDRE
jgi:hypothetical protein